MALVAYSDESDMSEEEEEVDHIAGENKTRDNESSIINSNTSENSVNVSATKEVDANTSALSSDEIPTNLSKIDSIKGSVHCPSSKYSPNGTFLSPKLSPKRSISNGVNNIKGKASPATSSSGVESIEDEDDDLNFVVPGRHNITSADPSLLSVLPAVSRTSDVSPSSVHPHLDVGEDELTDVPTIDTWKITQNLLKNKATEGKDNHPTHNSSHTNSIIKEDRRLLKSATSTNVASTSSGSSTASSMSSQRPPLMIGKARQFALASSALGSLLLERSSVMSSSSTISSSSTAKKTGRSAGKVQLMLPAMTELVEDEEEELPDASDIKKKVAPSAAGTGLFSLLPPPKHFTKSKEAKRSLVPHILSKPPTAKTANSAATKASAGKSKHVKASRKSAPQKSTTVTLLGDYEDSDDEEDNSTGDGLDFFSLEDGGNDSSVPAAASSSHLADSSMLIVNELDESSPSEEKRGGGLTTGIIQAAPSFSSDQSSSTTVNKSNDHQSSSSCDSSVMQETYDERESDALTEHGDSEDFIPAHAVEPLDVTKQMDDDAWRRLTGKKRKAEDLQIIDVNGADALLSREEWMNRAATAEKPTHSHSKKKGNLPTQQQKRKHTITYLAHQAKEREIELKNDWSTGKLKKQQTRAKYGF